MLGVPKGVDCEIPHLVMGLGCYKWYQSKTPGGVPVDCEIPHRMERGTKHSL